MAKSTSKFTVKVSAPLLIALLLVIAGLVGSYLYLQRDTESTDDTSETAVPSPSVPTPEPEATVPATLSTATFVPKTLEDTTCSDKDGTYLWDKDQGVIAVSVPSTVAASAEQELVDARAAVGAYLKKSPAADLKKLGVDVDADYKVTDISSFPNVAFATSCFGINLLEVQRLSDIPAVGTQSAAVIAAEDSGGVEGVLDGNRVAYLFVEDGGRYYMLRRAAYSAKDWDNRITSYLESCEKEGKTDDLASSCVSGKLTGDQEVATKLRTIEEQLVKDFPSAKAAVLKK